MADWQVAIAIWVGVAVPLAVAMWAAKKIGDGRHDHNRYQ